MDASLRILLVDDNADDRLLTVQQLAREFPDIRTRHITDAGGFAAALEEDDFQMVITDYRLGWTDGLAVLRAVKSRFPGCPVIMFTASGNEDVAIEAMKTGLEDYVVKSPSRFKRLPAVVRSCLERADFRRKAEEELRESQYRYRTLFDNAADAIFILDLSGRFLEANPVACDRLGYRREELLTMGVADIRVPDEAAKVAGMLETLRAAGTDFFETTHVRRDGSVLPVEVNARRIDYLGRPAVLSIARDITQRRKVEDALRASEEQLVHSQKMEAMGRLAGGIAHDFNNLLTAINGYCDLALSRLGPAHPLRIEVTEIRKAGERAAALTRQLLAFSRRQVLQPRVVDLNLLLSQLEQLLRRLIGEDIELVTVLDPGAGRIKADPAQIEQIVMNLVVNASDAMPGGGTLTIETAYADLDASYARTHAEVQPGAYAMLAVSDTGCGMDEATKSRLFEPFFTTKEHGKGTGLGLATVYGVVRQSGGNIWVYSEPGMGTTFKIYLPQAEGTAEPPEDEGHPIVSLEGNESVLLAEDEEQVRRLVREILASFGYRVLVARDGEEALSICERHGGPIDLLLTDVVMPGMNGRELAERAAGLRPKMKVLFMSGYSEDAFVHRGMLVPGTDLIQKPFRPNDLVRMVRKVLDEPRKGGSSTE